jgi:hypothetical protein
VRRIVEQEPASGVPGRPGARLTTVARQHAELAALVARAASRAGALRAAHHGLS